MPRKSKRAFVIGPVAFVPHPQLTGLWLKTDTSVVKVACPFCHAAIHEPCRRANSTALWTSSTHWRRRAAARGVAVAATGAVVYT